ncbi:MAG: sigma 54-interacting transcriptional regulator [Myxococcota bacterium]
MQEPPVDPATLVRTVANAAMNASNSATLVRRVTDALTLLAGVEEVGFEWSGAATKRSPDASNLLFVRVEGEVVASVAIRFHRGELVDPETAASIESILSLAAHNLRLVQRVAALSKRAHERNRELTRRLRLVEPSDAIVAVSRTMREVVAAAELVAAHPTTVLITGESGTGKELLARHVHRCSLRSAAPFVAVNCGALPDAMIESELFGHERGAFTGAIGARRGRFEVASGGTLFLDEVGDLNLASQVKLLRALQEGTIERLGAERSLRVDVRVIAATHRDLPAMVRAGAFREDLFYRLNVFPVHIPPLRSRPEDVPELARRKLAELALRSEQPKLRLSRATLGRLGRHPWPGNVRELENVLERAFIQSREGKLELPDLQATAPLDHKPSGDVPTFADAVRNVIGRALTECKGRVYGEGGAAQLLGLNPSTLQSKMRKYAIERAHYVPITSDGAERTR